MVVDNQNKRIFAGECKYHAKPVDAPVYYALREKVLDAGEIRKSYPGYDIIYGVFGKVDLHSGCWMLQRKHKIWC